MLGELFPQVKEIPPRPLSFYNLFLQAMKRNAAENLAVYCSNEAIHSMGLKKKKKRFGLFILKKKSSDFELHFE